jgi:hypothetical protein
VDHVIELIVDFIPFITRARDALLKWFVLFHAYPAGVGRDEHFDW